MTYYPKQWSSASPGLLIFLIDQSVSTSNVSNESFNSSKFCANFVNYQINTIIKYHFSGFQPKNRCYIEVIGYSDNANVLCSGFLIELYENPIKIITIRKKISDGAGGLVEIDKKMPIWVEPVMDGVHSNAVSAFQLALNTIQKWIDKYPGSPAPIIVNISHSIPKSPFLDEEKTIDETICLSNKIKDIGAINEKSLILSLINTSEDFFNIYEISEKKQKYKNFLENLSSNIPEYYEWFFEKRDLNFNKIKHGIVHLEDIPEIQQIIIFNNDAAEELGVKDNQHNN